MVILQLHKLESRYLRTDPVKESFRGEIVWQGDVEVFAVEHPKAKHCYGWSIDEDTPNEKFTAVLGVPPINSALDAVRAPIVADQKRSK